MLDWFKDLHMALPFMLSAGASQPKMSVSRIVEAIVIAAIASVGASYLTVRDINLKQEIAQKQFEDQVKRRNEEVSAVKNDLREANQLQQARYEVIRSELQRIALATERLKR